MNFRNEEYDELLRLIEQHTPLTPEDWDEKIAKAHHRKR